MRIVVPEVWLTVMVIRACCDVHRVVDVILVGSAAWGCEAARL